MTEQGGNARLELRVVAIVEDLIQDWGLELGERIGATTRLFQDLDFASVDIIQLCVAIEQDYERKLGFQDLLMREGAYVSELTIGEITAFVAKRINGEEL